MKRKWIVLGSLAALLSLFAFEDVRHAIAQLPNTLNISSAPSGTAPAIRASGIDANVSINLVPKGSGTVNVNGTAIATSGGTVASLNVGSLFIQPGTAVTFKRVGARIAHNITDAATTGVAIETLYTFSIQANTLAVNGESLRFTVYATTVANANSKVLDLTFGATTIGTLTAAGNDDLYRMICDLYRTGAATQKAICWTAGGDLTTAGALTAARAVVTTPAETLSGAVAVLVRGTTPTAIADLVARAATIDWNPVGQ